jgi:hypothetical protein
MSSRRSRSTELTPRFDNQIVLVLDLRNTVMFGTGILAFLGHLAESALAAPATHRPEIEDDDEHEDEHRRADSLRRKNLTL